MTAHVRITTQLGGAERWTRAVIDPTVARSSITLSEAKKLGCNIYGGRTTISVFHRSENRRRILVDCTVETKKYGRSPKFSIERSDRRGPGEMSTSFDANRHWHRSLEYHLILGADV
ncbi:hypothetical protein FF38_04199 [Lucilia cuprina]|uniref:Uncharacterized protein n=1 Tax=Lucilia cuprina TaxID=7375 RepID=A0A0L0BWX4_LUCCU|nr:hypothetical protein FF38_04199 [Lucilia cuprina]